MDKCTGCGTELMDCGILGVECPNRQCPDNVRLMAQVRNLRFTVKPAVTTAPVELKCHSCGVLLNTAPDTLDCGGDCLRCVAAAGDPDALRTLAEFDAKKNLNTDPPFKGPACADCRTPNECYGWGGCLEKYPELLGAKSDGVSKS